MAEGGATPRKWSSNLMFLAAAIGSAVGMTNIWKFTYVAGANGGGAFVIIYLLACAAIVFPALVAEFLIGRRGGGSVVGNMRVLAERENISPRWRYFAFMALLGVFLALSFYAVVAGWMVDYFVLAASGRFGGLDASGAAAMLQEMMGDPLRMMFYQALFLAATALTVSLGIHKGLERVLSWMTPGLFVILLVLLGYSVLEADFAGGVRFLFNPDFSRVDAGVVLAAIGQAFFSIGVGVGVLMTIGAYMDRQSSIMRSSVVVVIADAAAAICAGLAIFPIILAHGLSPAEGPGLVFATLPIAFSQIVGGSVLGALFFILVAVAAFTSAVTLMETIVAWLEEATRLSRGVISLMVGAALWLVGLLTVFSFNIWADFHPLGFWKPMAGKTVFDVLDYLVSNIIMPLGGILVAVLAGWALSRKSAAEELGLDETGGVFRLWLFATRFLVPVAVLALFIVNLG